MLFISVKCMIEIQLRILSVNDLKRNFVIILYIMSKSHVSIDFVTQLTKRTFTITDVIKLLKTNINNNIIEDAFFPSNKVSKGGESQHKYYRQKCAKDCIATIMSVKKNKRTKVLSDNFIIPPIEKYTELIKRNFSVPQLKTICRHYKQKVSGNKNELQNRIFFYMLRSCDASIIQRAWRKHIVKKYHLLRGPAIVRRELCVNDTDFCSMESLKDISYTQFFSYKDTDDKIYGFDLTSLFTLLSKGNLNTTNPYNRKVFPRRIRKKINSILRIAQIMKDTIVLDIEEPEKVTPQKLIEQRTIDTFHYMDLLGNYTNTSWFTSLGRAALIRFIRELSDIWMYRAQLSETTKREICPPHGNPFGNVLLTLLNCTTNNLKKHALDIIEKMVKTGVNQPSQCLGANYVLCAFTLVNENARDSLPWLYQSVA